MNAIDILIDLIKHFEGCRLTAYQCPAGIWTIGYGHTAGVKPGDSISQQYADALLRQDAHHCHDAALLASPVLRNASPSQQAAIADFIFNLGLANYQKSGLKRCVDAKDWGEAQHEIRRWDKATVNGKKQSLAGLTSRRNREAELLSADAI